MIADEDEQAVLAVSCVLVFKVLEDPLDYVVHLALFRSHQMAHGTTEMSNMV